MISVLVLKRPALMHKSHCFNFVIGKTVKWTAEKNLFYFSQTKQSKKTESFKAWKECCKTLLKLIIKSNEQSWWRKSKEDWDTRWHEMKLMITITISWFILPLNVLLRNEYSGRNFKVNSFKNDNMCYVKIHPPPKIFTSKFNAYLYDL